jgi:prevent-host-death family protein
MKVVGVADLKARLSSHLESVKEGEEVVVTDHGRPIARIVPVEAKGLPERVARLARQGLVRLPDKPPRRIRPRVADPEGRLLAALLEEREEGR